MLHETWEFYFWLDLFWSHGPNVSIVHVIQSCPEDQTSTWSLCLMSALGFGEHLLHIWSGASGLIFSKGNLVHKPQNSSANGANEW